MKLAQFMLMFHNYYSIILLERKRERERKGERERETALKFK